MIKLYGQVVLFISQAYPIVSKLPFVTGSRRDVFGTLDKICPSRLAKTDVLPLKRAREHGESQALKSALQTSTYVNFSWNLAI